MSITFLRFTWQPVYGKFIHYVFLERKVNSLITETESVISDLFYKALDKELPIVTVNHGNLTLTIKRSSKKIEIKSDIVGYLVGLVDEGQEVKEGDIIAEVKVPGFKETHKIKSFCTGIVTRQPILECDIFRKYKGVEFGTVIVVMNVINKEANEND